MIGGVRLRRPDRRPPPLPRRRGYGRPACRAVLGTSRGRWGGAGSPRRNRVKTRHVTAAGEAVEGRRWRLCGPAPGGLRHCTQDPPPPPPPAPRPPPGIRLIGGRHAGSGAGEGEEGPDRLQHTHTGRTDGAGAGRSAGCPAVTGQDPPGRAAGPPAAVRPPSPGRAARRWRIRTRSTAYCRGCSVRCTGGRAGA